MIRERRRTFTNGHVQETLVMRYDTETQAFEAVLLDHDGNETEEYDADGFAFTFGTSNLVRETLKLAAGFNLYREYASA